MGASSLLYQAQGRYGEAEPLHKRAIAAFERVLGKERSETLTSVNNLASLYHEQGRYGEAESLYRRVLEASERTLGREHPDTLRSLYNLAALYDNQGRSDEAEPLYRRLLAAAERVLGREHPKTLTTMNNLAFLYQGQRRYSEAEPLYRRVLEARERVLGKQHPETLISLANLATLYDDQGRYNEAEPLYRRVLEARERTLGREHPDTLTSANNLAAFYFQRSDWGHAAEFWRRSTAALAVRVQRDAQDATQVLLGKKKSEAERKSGEFLGLVKVMYRLTPEGRALHVEASREMFETAQWAQSSEAAASLVQMAARGAKGDQALAALTRERQDLVAEWQKRDGLRNATLGQESARRNPQAEAENNTRLAVIDARIKEIDKELAVKFPDYAALTSPAPLAAEEVQAQLGADEALVLFLDTPEAKPTPEETFIWVVTKTELRWVRSDLGTKALARELQALRCGLDAEAWADRPCADLTGQSYTDADRKAGKPLPFDHARAYRLYQALFGQAEDLIKGKQLLIVPSGALTQLPFQVLVTAAPTNGDQRSAAWLVREHGLTVLPAVSSLKALRRVSRPSAANNPMIGFGNPLLDGRQNDPEFGAYYKKLAQSARDKQRCPETPWQRIASLAGLRRGVTPVQTRGGFADRDFILFQTPLPETADELCAVARDIGADMSQIRLGARATEGEVKRLSESGQLAQYRIVHFATHGALAGQIRGNAEPGLLLTPPDTPTEEDDGYLTASEIAALKLDADWVVLSACNTAAGGAQGAEALSGLARAFIYAQARALLVSHWEVNSDATVKLVTGAMSRLAANKSIGRAEALRQSMLALIDKGEPREAHPAYWAPFVLVGEGGAGR
ncbi:MAG: CHAT domain-containing tetratricopeptide repeat protein [Rhodomicrobium sp.]